MIVAAPPRRRWLRFSLRTLFALVTIFCIWLAVQVKWIRDRNAGRVWMSQHAAERGVGFSAGYVPDDFPWVLRILHEREGSRTYFIDGNQLSDADMEYFQRLQSLFPESQILLLR